MPKQFVFVKAPNGDVSERFAEYVKPEDGEILSTREGRRIYREQCIEELRRWINPGDKVYCLVRSVSRSGMTRRIDVFIVRGGELQRISWHVEKILELQRNDDGLRVTGCGMDMCFHTVYSLARCLFPEGYGEEGTRKQRGLTPLTKRAMTKEHADNLQKRGFEFPWHGGKRVGWIADGGYALKAEKI